MRYSIELRNITQVKGYRFLSFAKNNGIYATKVVKSMGNNYSQKRIDSTRKSTTETLTTDLKK